MTPLANQTVLVTEANRGTGREYHHPDYCTERN